MNNDGNCIRGRRLTNDESMSMMFPDIPMMTDNEIDSILDKFNTIPLINPIPISEIEKTMETTK